MNRCAGVPNAVLCKCKLQLYNYKMWPYSYIKKCDFFFKTQCILIDGKKISDYSASLLSFSQKDGLKLNWLNHKSIRNMCHVSLP